MENKITQDLALEYFEYSNGALYWKKKPGRGTAVGSRAGTVCKSNNRRSIRLFGIRDLEYRVIFLMHYGYFPEMVDHIDGDVTNNKIENLRASSRTTNQHNAKLSSRNTSGVKNVSWNSHSKRWQVIVCYNRKQKNYGEYEDLELAELVAIEARNKVHGEFARHK